MPVNPMTGRFIRAGSALFSMVVWAGGGGDARAAGMDLLYAAGGLAVVLAAIGSLSVTPALWSVGMAALFLAELTGASVPPPVPTSLYFVVSWCLLVVARPPDKTFGGRMGFYQAIFLIVAGFLTPR